MTVTCAHCHRQVINTAPDPVVSEKVRYFPVTLMLVYLVMLLGIGYSGIETVCGMLSLKHFTFETKDVINMNPCLKLMCDILIV